MISHHVRDAISRGLPVFRLGKKPHKKGQTPIPGNMSPLVRYRFDTNIHYSWDTAAGVWTDDSPDNFAVRTGWSPVLNQYLVVIDVDDNGETKLGFDSLEQMEKEFGALPETLSVRTPSGGLHLYFVSDHDIHNSTSAIGQWIDVRGYHGYVVGAGSRREATLTKNAGGYFIESDLPIAQIPAWLEKLCLEKNRYRADLGDGVSHASALDIENAPRHGRNEWFWRKASSLRGQGMGAADIAATLISIGEQLDPPADLPEIQAQFMRMAKRVSEYETNADKSEREFELMIGTFREVVEIISKEAVEDPPPDTSPTEASERMDNTPQRQPDNTTSVEANKADAPLGLPKPLKKDATTAFEFKDVVFPSGPDPELQKRAEELKKQHTMIVEHMGGMTNGRMHWLFDGYFPLGMLTQLAGESGVSKTTFALTVAAAVTRGRPLIPGMEAPPLGDVLIISSEDSSRFTVRPRLDAAGADLDRCMFIPNFDIQAHPEQLDDLLSAGDYKLIIIDPITAFMGSGKNMNDNTDARVIGNIWKAVAEKFNLSIVGINHFGKAKARGANQILGAGAWVQVFRQNLVVVADTTIPDTAHVACVQANHKFTAPLTFERCEKPVKDDEGTFDHLWLKIRRYDGNLSASELIAAQQEETRPQTKSEIAVSFLQRELTANGPVPSAVLIARAKDEGIAQRTLENAKKTLGFKSVSINGEYCWDILNVPKT